VGNGRWLAGAPCFEIVLVLCTSKWDSCLRPFFLMSGGQLSRGGLRYRSGTWMLSKCCIDEKVCAVSNTVISGFGVWSCIVCRYL